MKLTVPAIRRAEPDKQRQEASELTVQLLREIDALLAESIAISADLGTRRARKRPASPAAA